MLDPKYIRENPEEAKRNAAARQVEVDIDAFLNVDGLRSEQLKKVEEIRAERNQIASEMKKKDLSEDERAGFIEKGKSLKDDLSAAEEELVRLETEWKSYLHRIPNRTHPDAPIGGTDEQNVEIRRHGEPAKEGKTHEELVGHLIDFERGAKVAGSKFYFLKNEIALLEWALLRYGIDFARKEGFDFMTTPDLAREEVLVGKGFLPRGPEKQVYFVEGEDLALIGTAEIPLLGYHMNETLAEEELPKKYAAFSHCFRTESGSYGRESAGLYRVHQFSKIELFSYALPDQSEGLLEEFVRLQEAFWKSLDIPYRVVDCCTGDLGGSDYRRYDIEAWMWSRNGGKGGWGEVTSASNCHEYQARGLGIQVKKKDGTRVYPHTLNGTMISATRAIIPLVENNVGEDGNIHIPEALRPYTGFDTIKV